MSKEESGNPEWAYLRCGLVGAVAIALVGGVGMWTWFVVGDRIQKTKAAQHLQGGWDTPGGGEFYFDFPKGFQGTLEAWQADAQSKERARVVWRRDNEFVIGVGPTEDREDYYLIRLSGNPDSVTMRPEGSGGQTMVLVRQKRGRR